MIVNFDELYLATKLLETQNLINSYTAKSQNCIKRLNKKSFVLFLATSTIGLVLYSQSKKIEKLSDKLEELTRMEGE